MRVCLDTDVLVDCLRGLPNARAWLEGGPTDEFVVPGIVAMELLAGARDQDDLRSIQAFLQGFEVIWPDARESARALELLAAHRLASGIGIPDAMIASLALERSLRLYSFNLKHFRVFEGLDVQAPYQR